MDDLLKLSGQWGWAAVAAMWLLVNGIPKLSKAIQSVVSRRWATDNHKTEKIGELYERLLTDQQAAFSTLSENTLALDRNSNAVEQMCTAIETEFPQVIQAVRESTGRISRLEEIIQKLESIVIETAQK